MKKFLLLLAVIFAAIPIAEAVDLSPGDSTKKKAHNLDASDFGFMDNDKLKNILEQQAKIVEGQTGFWQISFLNRPMLVITDQKNNRMRIMTPVVEEEKISADMYPEILRAQFDRTLDVKYAISQNLLWSVYIHPLKELTREQVIDALSQVFQAAQNFGSTYRSTGLEFGTSADEENAGDY